MDQKWETETMRPLSRHLPPACISKYIYIHELQRTLEPPHSLRSAIKFISLFLVYFRANRACLHVDKACHSFR